jgi:hypothetical protein
MIDSHLRDPIAKDDRSWAFRRAARDSTLPVVRHGATGCEQMIKLLALVIVHIHLCMAPFASKRASATLRNSADP